MKLIVSFSPYQKRQGRRFAIISVEYKKGEQNKELFKKLDGKEIWEFRTLFNKIVYRLFAFWDTETETLVIATHGIIKKTQKTPSKEIAKAEEVRKLYFEHKKKKMNMEQVGDMKFIDFEETLDRDLGKVGTPMRDEFERKVDESVHAYRLGEAIKKARLQQNLTQEQLGERIGVKRAQISKLEKGYSITIPTMSRVFKALGIATATLDLGSVGKVALW